MKKALLYIPIFFLIIYVGFFAYIKISLASARMVAFEAKLIEGNAIELHPLVENMCY